MRTTSMHFVNSLSSYLSSKVENRLLRMNERNYSLGDTFTVALQCKLKAIASERWHNKRNTITINNVNSKDQDHSQLEDIQEVHVRNPNYKGKNYDPNYQARKSEINKQQQQPTMTNNQYKAPYTRPAANHHNNLASYSRRGHPKNDRRWVPAVEDERTHQKCCSLEGEDAKDR